MSHELPRSTPPSLDLPVEEQLGSSIGPYKLREKVGEGGYGTVFVAEQEHPVRRRVALKIIKLGMDTRSVVARFEAERQALAIMDHPNIAKVLDAGSTASGRPYFVMELVRGIKITDYCDQNNLATDQRLALFIEVCHAVQHAHQKGIIHRDLKPSNILVTMHDGVPVPKVIDFGIAKATESRLTDLTVYTELHQFIGTPAYMSPEQAEMSGLDIDTRSDVYSLGVLLYELLTGITPFDSKELAAAGLDAMRQIIREVEPARPSTRLANLEHAELTTTARRRSAAAPRLIHSIKGDLDWIALKCLEKDRTRRYETANSLALDVQRHLHHEAVLARPPDALYRIRKAIRRNRVVFGTSALVLLALVSAVISTRVQAVRAKRAEALATQRLAEVTAERDAKEKARQGADEAAAFMRAVFKSPNPARDGRTITVAETLDRAVESLQSELKLEPERRVDLIETLASAYMNLGLYRSAAPLQEQVRDYWTAKSGSDSKDTIIAELGLANLYFWTEKRQDALALRESLLPRVQRVFGPEDSWTISTISALAGSYAQADRIPDAIRLGEEALALSRKVYGSQHDRTIGIMHVLADFYHKGGRNHEAVIMQDEVLKHRLQRGERETPSMVASINNLANYYASAGRTDEALKKYEEVLSLGKTVFGPEHPQTIIIMGNLAAAYSNTNRFDDALKLQEETVELSRKANGAEHPETIWRLGILGSLQRRLGRDADAVKTFEQTLELSRKVEGPEHRRTIEAMMALAGCYARADRVDDAIKLQKEILRLQKKLHPSRQGEWSGPITELGTLYNRAGRYEDSLAFRQERLQISQLYFGTYGENSLIALHEIAQVHLRLGQRDRARELFQELPLRGIRAWLVLAPFPADRDKTVEALQTEQIPGEAGIRPRAGDKHSSSNGVEQTWREAAMDGYVLNLAQFFDKPPEWTVAYAVTYIHSPTEHTNVTLWITTDDDAKAWLNGEEVYRSEKGRSIWSALDRVDGLSLKAGLNVLVIKDLNREYAWQLCANLTDPDGRPIPGLRVSSDPAERGEPLTESSIPRPGRPSRGNWKDLQNQLQQAIKRNPHAHWDWFLLAGVLLQNGETAAYESLREEMLPRFPLTNDYVIDQRTGLALLLRPTSGAMLKAAAALIDSSKEGYLQNNEFQYWVPDKALSEYRQGNFSNAVEWAGKLLTMLNDAPPISAQGYFLLSMAQQRLQQTSEAQTAFAKGKELIDNKIAKLDSADMGSGWVTALLAHLMMREAAEVLKATYSTAVANEKSP